MAFVGEGRANERIECRLSGRLPTGSGGRPFTECRQFPRLPPSIRRGSPALGQTPLPALARFERIAENIAAQDGSLSVRVRRVVDGRRACPRIVLSRDGSLSLAGNCRRAVIESNRCLDLPLRLLPRLRTAGLSNELPGRRRRQA